MTIDEIKERLRANGNPSIFEEHVLDYIEELELRITALHKELARCHYKALLADTAKDKDHAS